MKLKRPSQKTKTERDANEQGMNPTAKVSKMDKKSCTGSFPFLHTSEVQDTLYSADTHCTYICAYCDLEATHQNNMG